MSALPSMSPQEQAARYERYISENWDSLSSFEQDQARSYMHAKMQASQMQVQAAAVKQPGMPAAQPGVGQMPAFAAQSPGVALDNYSAAYYGGYGPGAFGPPKVEQGGGWAVWVGYIMFLFIPLVTLGCGIYLCTKGRTGHGIAQLMLAAASILIGFMLLAAA
jgi:hypothetical protein